jgi:hypothetical protein
MPPYIIIFRNTHHSVSSVSRKLSLILKKCFPELGNYILDFHTYGVAILTALFTLNNDGWEKFFNYQSGDCTMYKLANNPKGKRKAGKALNSP